MVAAFLLAQITGRALAQVQLASAAPGGVAADGDNRFVDMSADGRFLVFASSATNLVPDGADQLTTDVVLLDRLDGTLDLVTVGPGGVPTSQECTLPHVSDDGRFVVFSSKQKLWAPFANGEVPSNAWSVWVRDRLEGTTTLASLTQSGVPFNGAAIAPAISGSGRFVSFTVSWPGLDPRVTQIVLRDLLLGTTELVSTDANGRPAMFACLNSRLSSDGRFVAFDSSDTSLAGSPAPPRSVVYLKDRRTGATEQVSVSTDGSPADDDATCSSMSRDGSRVAFHSAASNLVPGDTNQVTDCFVRDLEAGWTRRVSIATDGSEGSKASIFPALSPCGRYVAFTTSAPEFASEAGELGAVFLHDLESGATELISLSIDGEPVDGGSGRGCVGRDGLLVAFGSEATNLVATDGNGSMADIFLSDRGAFEDLGGASTPGVRLLATGSLLPGSQMTVMIDLGSPSAAGLLLVGGASASMPYAGGVLHAAPALASVPILAQLDGEAALTAHWPANAPAGLQIILQPLVAGATSLLLGNACAGTAP